MEEDSNILLMFNMVDEVGFAMEVWTGTTTVDVLYVEVWNGSTVVRAK